MLPKVNQLALASLVHIRTQAEPSLLPMPPKTNLLAMASTGALTRPSQDEASLDEFTRQSLKVRTFVVTATESDNLAHSCGYAGKTSVV